jgi:tRNA-binding protein
MSEEQWITWSDFEKVDIRVGTIITAQIFEAAKKPAYILKKSSAQITVLYKPEELIGRQVMAVVNFPPKQVAKIKSECLVLGVVDGANITLLTSDKPVANGLRIG